MTAPLASPLASEGELITQVFDRIGELAAASGGVLQGLSRFLSDDAVRILTIHKSKGLEFDTVIMLAVETGTFWGKADEERSAYFVGISRAKRRLLLSVAGRRARPILKGKRRPLRGSAIAVRIGGERYFPFRPLDRVAPSWRTTYSSLRIRSS